MRRMPRWMSTVAVAAASLALTACPVKGKAPEDAGTPAPPRFTPPGKCFGKPSKCISDSQCGPPLSTCQEGTCCSGVLDLETCECRCAGGPPCKKGELCCAREEASRGGGLRCRPAEECFGPF